MNVIVFILFAAVSPLVSADKYTFTIPNVTNNIRGRVMGPNGDYSVVRSEDVAFIWEAIKERDMMSEGGSYPYAGIDSYVIKSLYLGSPSVGKWYTNSVVFISDRIDISDGPGKRAWDEGGARMAAVAENYADLAIPGFELTGVYCTNEITRMYSGLNMYSVLGLSPHSDRLVGISNVELDRQVSVWYEWNDKRESWEMSTNSYDKTYSSTGQASMSFYSRTDMAKELHRSFNGTDLVRWKENKGSPYTCLSGYSYKSSPSRLIFHVSLPVTSGVDTKNWTHRVGVTAEAFVTWSISSYDRGVRGVCENGETRFYEVEYEPEKNVTCLSRYTGSYFGVDAGGRVEFRFTVDDFDSEIMNVASIYGISAVWNAPVPDPVTPTPSPNVFQSHNYNILSSETRDKYVMIRGYVQYVVIYPDLPTKIQ